MEHNLTLTIINIIPTLLIMTFIILFCTIDAKLNKKLKRKRLNVHNH